MNAKIFRKRSRTLVAALILISVAGCVGRKQYQINEAILISERRQLEDELYRLQFELRDALEENERLRAAAGENANGAKKSAALDVFAQTQNAAQNANSANEPAALFPKSNALQVSRPTRGTARLSANSANGANSADYRGSAAAPSTGGAVETLPEYVPIPLSSAPSPSRPNAKPLGVRRSVANAAAPAATPKIAASNYVENAAAAPNVEATSYQNRSGNAVAPASPTPSADAWSPLAR